MSWAYCKAVLLNKKFWLYEKYFSAWDDFKHARYNAITASFREDIKSCRIDMVIAGRRLKYARESLGLVQKNVFTMREKCWMVYLLALSLEITLLIYVSIKLHH